MDKVLQSFEGLIRRSIAPSVTLFVMVGVVDLILVQLAYSSAEAPKTVVESFFSMVKPELGGADKISTVIIAMVIIGVSYGLAMLQQIFFDNRLRKNFDPWSGWRPRLRTGQNADEASALTELRAKVIARLREDSNLERFQGLEAISDYVLYEILGGIDPTDTRRFVDSAKSLGVTSISLMLALAVGVSVHWCAPGGWGLRIPLLLSVVVVFFVGHSAVKAQFRARAFRLYVNFLMMPPKRMEKLLLNPKAESLPKPTDEKKQEDKK